MRKIMGVALFCLTGMMAMMQARAADWVVYEGKEGPGKGKHIVLLSGDDEYRSEEGLPMLGKMLAQHHGFKCTVTFSVSPKDGTIDPEEHKNLPGLSALDSADMVVMLWRFRDPSDADMKHLLDYINAGKPIIGLRTSTHALDLHSPTYAKWAPFGKMVYGEGWVNHWGQHGSQSCRGIPDKENKSHPIMRGVEDVWGPTDVYEIGKLPEGTNVLLWGQVLKGMKPTDEALEGPKNTPMQALGWVREFKNEGGKSNKVICTTMGASQDLESEGLRRFVVNSCYWGMGMEVPTKADVSIVGEYKPTRFGFKVFTKGVKPADHEMK